MNVATPNELLQQSHDTGDLEPVKIVQDNAPVVVKHLRSMSVIETKHNLKDFEAIRNVRYGRKNSH